MTSLGQRPIVMNQELPGFALNRIQYVNSLTSFNYDIMTFNSFV